MSKHIALVDADGILYSAALKGETVCDGEQLQMVPLEKVYRDAVTRLEQAIAYVKGAEQSFVCLSDRRTFRMDLLPPHTDGSVGRLGYKGQRKQVPRPILLDGLRTKFADASPYRVLLIKGLEADDVCGISAGQLQGQGHHTTIVSPDKDLLQIPGTVCTPRIGAKPVYTEVTREMGDRMHLLQTLMGDTCDNYRGLPGWGARKAGEVLDLMDLARLEHRDRWASVIEFFEAAGLTREDALVQARVARILRAEDWDATAKAPILWEFPR